VELGSIQGVTAGAPYTMDLFYANRHCGAGSVLNITTNVIGGGGNPPPAAAARAPPPATPTAAPSPDTAGVPTPAPTPTPTDDHGHTTSAPTGAPAGTPPASPDELRHTELPSWLRDFTPADADFSGAATGDDKSIVANVLGDNGFPVYMDGASSTATTSGKASFDAWWVNATTPAPASAPRYQATTVVWGWDAPSATVSWSSADYWPLVGSLILQAPMPWRFLSSGSMRCTENMPSSMSL